MIIQTTKQLQPRRAYDHYPTPSPLVRAALRCLPEAFAPRVVLDHSTGTGVWLGVAKERWPKALTIGVEVQLVAAERRPPGVDLWYNGWSFVRYMAHALDSGHPRPDLIVGNPPFDQAEQFVRCSLAMLAPGGMLIQLLRLAFVESRERVPLFRDYCPTDMWTLVKRPGFLGWHKGNRRTDNTAYAIFLWRKDESPTSYRGQWLQWDYTTLPMPHDEPFRPMRLLPAPSLAIPVQPLYTSLGIDERTIV